MSAIAGDRQHQRLLAGAAVALAKYGYAEMNVGHVLEHAGVSRTTFYEHFENKRECVLIAHGQAVDQLAGELVRACAAQSEWAAKVAAAIGAAIDFAVRAPEQAQLLIVDAVAAEPALVDRALASNDFFAGLLRNGREQCPQAAPLPPMTEQALVGATASVIGRKLPDQADRLPALKPQLTELVLMPYLGQKEAKHIAL